MSFDITNHWNALFMMPDRLVDPPSWTRHIPFAFFLVDLVRPKTLVELGVHTGNSFCAFCQAATYFQTSTLCHGVDTFQGDEHAGHYDDHIFQDLQAHVQAHYQDFAQLLRMTFDVAAGRFSDGSIDLLHIDGLHTYEAVRHDFDTWLPRMSERGLILLHDIHVRRDDFGVWQLWEELKEHYPSFAFRHGHGLGLLATGPQAPKEVQAFISAANQDERIERVFVEAGDRLAKALRVKELEHLHAASAQRLAELEPHVSNLEKLREEMETHSANLEAHNANLEAMHADMEQRVQTALAELETMRSSLSWRLTKPLRALGAVMRIG